MLEVRNLYKSFDVAGKRQRVIEDLSFVVQDRDFYTGTERVREKYAAKNVGRFCCTG